MELIFCGGNNRRFAEIAHEAGFLLGAQLPSTVYLPIYFADQDWKKPNREKYMDALAKHQPHVATVLDLEQESQIDEVLAWAEEAARWVQVVMIIPKVFGIIPQLPRQIGGADIRLGYSVPTKFAGTEVPLWEFDGWPVHLLGGSPQVQMELTRYLNVASVDGNMAMKMATQFGAFFDPGKTTKRGCWPSILDYDGERWPEDNAPVEAFRRSCANIMLAWQSVK